MRTRSLGLSAAAVLVLLSLGLRAAEGQEPSAPKALKVTVQAANADVRETLRAIFKQVGISYTIDPGVQGAVSADYKELALEDALRLVLRQVGATWRIEGGVYMVVSRQAAALALPPGVAYLPHDPDSDTLVFAPPTNDPTVMATDEGFVYVVRAGVLHKVAKSTMKEVGKVDLNDRKIKIVY